ncbi:uncharacterized protein LOC108034721 [Drosophila biarmipes]|uniref:uncharacterized protein LOC108034721 n=1 Tax=Drosophila biarmipes TaxID=125945 RepID=UPI0007E6F83B|nr:uncharacterized protein LOC108034721 [Drosophila biarmipes]
MSVEDAISSIPDEVIDYLVQQRRRERDLTVEKQVLKERIRKVQDMLKLLEGRDSALPCTISGGNVYQQCTVQQVKDSLAANLSHSMALFVKAHRKLLRLQQDLNQDYETVCDNVSRIAATN